MGSITDIVTEGLKYPFNDGKKVLSLGAIFAFIGIISLISEYLLYSNISSFGNSMLINGTFNQTALLTNSNSQISILVWFISFILLIFIMGYQYNVIKYAIESKTELPDFNSIGEMFFNGLKILAVTIVYLIIPIILFAFGTLLNVNRYVGSAVNSIGSIIILIAIILSIVALFVEIMAINHMVAKDKVSAALKIKEIFASISKLGILKFIGVVIFTGIVVSVISIFFGFIFSFISLLIGYAVGNGWVSAVLIIILTYLLLRPYTSILVSRVCGSIYRESNNVELEE